MKITITSLILLSILSGCSKPAAKEEQVDNTVKQNKVTEILTQSEPDTLKGSLDAVATGKIGGVNISIRYHSPAVRGRIVWGGLVPYDRVWVTGAHMATVIEFDGEILVGDTPVAAGKYALFTIPGKEMWTLILNKNWQQHLTDNYDPKDDVVRVQVKPETEEPHQERLRYVIETESPTSCEVVIYWEKLEISLPVSIQD